MTSGKKILGVTAGAVLLLVVGKVGLGFMNQPDDKTLILEAVKEAQKAGKEGRPGGVLDFIDVSKLKINGDDAGFGGKEIANYVKNSKPDIEFTKMEPIVTGEDARIESPAIAKVSIATYSKDIPFGNVVIYLKKEVQHEWLFIPKKVWKLTEIRVDAADLASFSSGS